MKLFTFVLFIVLCASLYYLGFGKNGWMDYKYYQEKIAEREASNEALTERNNIMEVEIKDHPDLGKWALPGGFAQAGESIEETARRELGYIKRDETFVRVIEKEDK